MMVSKKTAVDCTLFSYSDNIIFPKSKFIVIVSFKVQQSLGSSSTIPDE